MWWSCTIALSSAATALISAVPGKENAWCSPLSPPWGALPKMAYEVANK